MISRKDFYSQLLFMRYIKKYIKNVLIAVDQLINALLFGDPDETLSSRLGKLKNRCKPCYYICKMLSIFDKRHCEKAIEEDEGFDDFLRIWYGDEIYEKYYKNRK